MARETKESLMTSYRPEFGNVAMTDEQYSRAKGAFSDVDKAAKAAAQKAKSKIPGYKEPEMVRVVAGGDNDPGVTYHLPKDAVESILNELVQASGNYYHYVKHADDLYGVAFGEYGKEGYEALNDVSSRVQQALAARKKQYNKSKLAAVKSIDMQVAGVQKQKQAVIKKWQEDLNKSIAANSELMNRLVQSGILIKKGTFK